MVSSSKKDKEGESNLGNGAMEMVEGGVAGETDRSGEFPSEVGDAMGMVEGKAGMVIAEVKIDDPPVADDDDSSDDYDDDDDDYDDDDYDDDDYDDDDSAIGDDPSDDDDDSSDDYDDDDSADDDDPADDYDDSADDDCVNETDDDSALETPSLERGKEDKAPVESSTEHRADDPKIVVKATTTTSVWRKMMNFFGRRSS